MFAFVLLISCKPSTMCKVELINYIKDPSNGLKQELVLDNDIILTCSFRPSELVFERDSTYKDQTGFHWFTISVEHIGDDSFQFLDLTEKLNKKINSQKDWFIIEQETKLFPSVYSHAVSYYGTISKFDYLVAFNTMELKEKDFVITFKPLATSRSLSGEFVFNYSIIKKAPTLKGEC